MAGCEVENLDERLHLLTVSVQKNRETVLMHTDALNVEGEPNVVLYSGKFLRSALVFAHPQFPGIFVPVLLRPGSFLCSNLTAKTFHFTLPDIHPGLLRIAWIFSSRKVVKQFDDSLRNASAGKGVLDSASLEDAFKEVQNNLRAVTREHCDGKHWQTTL